MFPHAYPNAEIDISCNVSVHGGSMYFSTESIGDKNPPTNDVSTVLLVQNRINPHVKIFSSELKHRKRGFLQPEKPLFEYRKAPFYIAKSPFFSYSTPRKISSALLFLFSGEVFSVSDLSTSR